MRRRHRCLFWVLSPLPIKLIQVRLLSKIYHTTLMTVLVDMLVQHLLFSLICCVCRGHPDGNRVLHANRLPEHRNGIERYGSSLCAHHIAHRILDNDERDARLPSPTNSKRTAGYALRVPYKTPTDMTVLAALSTNTRPICMHGRFRWTPTWCKSRMFTFFTRRF